MAESLVAPEEAGADEGAFAGKAALLPRMSVPAVSYLGSDSGARPTAKSAPSPRNGDRHADVRARSLTLRFAGELPKNSLRGAPGLDRLPARAELGRSGGVSVCELTLRRRANTAIGGKAHNEIPSGAPGACANRGSW